MTDKKGDLTGIRREYVSDGLSRKNLKPNPVDQFADWFAQALELHPDDASSMTLATASANGRPSARIVLLKHFGEAGFCWYTDYRSQKGRDLDDNPQAELLFYWADLNRQIRINGRVEKLPAAQGTHYFHQRPIGSQLSAIASVQSQVIDSREYLENKVAELKREFKNSSLPCPEQWGGYQLVPERFEFWQGREDRLHDRLVYEQADTGWQIKRLQP